ncbi:MAG: DUF3037 domain-containing protein [Chloroflexales bacterium]|nr:DUF3037 domain-containing protein [Chloroflexales bacterium]
MLVRNSFDYAIVRVVPRVERGEFLNAGVILFCRTRRFLAAQVELNETRLCALDPNCDYDGIRRNLATIPLICAGGAESGPIGQLSLAERFHWLVSPRSTIIQTSPVHSGLCTNPAVTLERLITTLVRLPESAPSNETRRG